MNIKNHPEYWNVHKEIWQQEYDELAQPVRDSITNDPYSKETKNFNSKIHKLIERKVIPHWCLNKN